MIKVLAEVKVIARRPKQAAKPMGIPPATRQVIPWVDYGTFNLVVIGISSGGPQTLLQVFSKISEKFPTPILVVQHIAEGFLGGLISWLGRTTAIPIQIATNGELLVAGRIYFAPDLHQMGVTRNGRVVLEKCHRKNGLCPSVAHLFESAAREFGKSALGIILTGMGQDGAQELKMLRETGAVTIAQDKKSSLIHGMPGVAIQLDAAKYILSAEEISQLLFKMETNT
jgi:two-component system chemotaxis response regulator CheB